MRGKFGNRTAFSIITPMKPTFQGEKKRRRKGKNMSNKLIREDPGRCTGTFEIDQPQPKVRLGRRSFLTRLGLGGTALLPVSGWLGSKVMAKDDKSGRNITRGDVAILR